MPVYTRPRDLAERWLLLSDGRPIATAPDEPGIRTAARTLRDEGDNGTLTAIDQTRRLAVDILAATDSYARG